MFTYAPKRFTGKHAAQIMALLILANRTMSKNLVRVMDNVKNEEHVTTISGDVPWVPYQEEITEADLAAIAANSTLKFSDKTVMPRKVMALDKFLQDQLRNSRFSADMKAGAANITSDEFQQAVISYLVPRLGKSFEKMFYLSITAADKATIAASSAPAAQKAWAAAQPAGMIRGVVSQMILAGVESAPDAVIAVAGTTVTASNIAAEYKKIHAGLPSAVASKATLFVPEGDFAIILQMNDDQQFRDKITVSGDDIETATVKYLGMKIEFVPIEGLRFAGLAGTEGNFVLATDLTSDLNEFKIDKVNNMGDATFGKMVAALDAAVLVPQQMVLYI